MYPRPTSTRVFSFLDIEGMFSKNPFASSTSMSRTSEMFFPLYEMPSVSLLYLFPWHSLHSTYTSGRKFISIFRTPSPWQLSHLPPLTLKENLPSRYPRTCASLVEANSFLISSKSLVYVAGLLRGVLPIGSWSITITFLTMPGTSNVEWAPMRSACSPNFFLRSGITVWFISVLFPEPDTPVIPQSTPRGSCAVRLFRLFSLAPVILM